MYGVGIGTKTSTGGEVVEGNTGIKLDDLVPSSIGHKATCKSGRKECRGIGPIVAVGSRSVHLPAGLAARVGDYIDCGCPPNSNVIVGSSSVSIGVEKATNGSHILSNSSLGDKALHFKSGKVFDTESLLYSHSFQRSADKYNVIIALRYPSEIGQVHLKEGHPSKNFHVKAKSSNSGPTAGFIPEKALYSKKQLKHDQYIKEACDKGAKLVPLKLSKNQISYLSENELLKLRGEKYIAVYHDQVVEFTIDGNGYVYDGVRKVQVLTNPPELGYRSYGTVDLDNPITADYDLFDLIFNQKQCSGNRPLTVPPRYIHSGLKNQSTSFQSAVNYFTIPKSLGGNQETPDRGNTSYFEDIVIDDLNKNFISSGYKGGVLVWHNDESGNPFSPGFDPKDKPVFFIPNSCPRQVYSKSELSSLYKEFQEAGYQAKLSSRF
ncbi:anthrax toxin-like adenylyl cyclase domain-containing protein [Vibrio sp. TBV020]|uniref:anthrax toxin-like adenylyl cyclase domain-containing protein n=1 Tax=Vibrio sp. TBV020 TaxID=3137398 RepID=UPI0038CD45D8